jgi:ankyrin repeat protein
MKSSQASQEKRRISSKKLDQLISENIEDGNLALGSLLESHGYSNDLTAINIDMSRYKQLDKLDMSGLVLTNCKIKGLSATSISFEGANLTNANINFAEGNESKVDFKDAIIHRAMIRKMNMNQAAFENTSIKEAMIIGSEANKANVPANARSEVIDLVVAPERSFHQIDLIPKHKEFTNNTGGICFGLCIEMARSALAHQAKGTEQKEYTKKLRDKINNPSMNFVYRVASYTDNIYQGKLKNQDVEMSEVANHNFMGSLSDEVKKSDMIGCGFSVDAGHSGHQVAIVTVRNKAGEVEGYKLFDPNYGEVLCANEKEVNQQMNLTFQLYQNMNNVESDRTGNGYVRVADLTEFVRQSNIMPLYDLENFQESVKSNKAQKYNQLSDDLLILKVLNDPKSIAEDLDQAIIKLKKYSAKQMNDKGTGLLHRAIKSNHMGAVNALLEKGANIGVVSGQTTIECAKANGNAEMIGVIEEAVTKRAALKAQHLEAIKAKFENETILDLKVMKEKMERREIASFFKKKEKDLVFQEVLQDYLSGPEGNVQLLKIVQGTSNVGFMSIEGNLNQPLASHANGTMLHAMVTTECSSNTKMGLIMVSPSMNVTDDFGRTPFNLAAKENNLEFAKMLIEYDSIVSLVDTKDSDGKTPLDYARENNNEEFIKLVMDQKPLEIAHNPSERKANPAVRADLAEATRSASSIYTNATTGNISTPLTPQASVPSQSKTIG